MARDTRILEVTAAAPCRTFTGLPKVEFPPPLAGTNRPRTGNPTAAAWQAGRTTSLRSAPRWPQSTRQPRAQGGCRSTRCTVGPARGLCFCQLALTPKSRTWCRVLPVLLACLSACHPAPAVALPPPAVTVPPVPAPPPPAPKCQALSDNCTATDDSVLPVGERGTSLAPPAGWKFAKQSELSLAVGSDGKSLLSASEIASGAEADVLESLRKLVLAAHIDNVKLDALKRRFKKPQITVDAHGVPVDLWEVSKATAGVNPELVGQGSGTLLVFVARLGTDRVVTGLGFVVVPDSEPDAEKVMHAVQSLKVSP